MKIKKTGTTVLYGSKTIDLKLNTDRVTTLKPASDPKTIVLSDKEIKEKIESPINSEKIEKIVGVKEKTIIVVPDATRYVGADKIITIVIDKLISSGIPKDNISILIGGGIHRSPSQDEIDKIIGKKIARYFETNVHDANDDENLIYVGETERGTLVRLNKKLVEADHIIQIGGIGFHYIAGFSGGRKGILPGCGAETTIQQNHKLAFDKKTLRKSENIHSGNLKDNPVHEDMLEAVGFINPSFAINTVLNSEREIINVYAGHWKDSHLQGCEEYKKQNSVTVNEKRRFVIVSPGGFPKDINLIQSHKAMEHGSVVLEDGGTMIVIAECSQGLGRDDFLDWFVENGANGTAEKLLNNYKVYGQTAWGIGWKAEKFNVILVSDLEPEIVKKTGLNPCPDIDTALKSIEPEDSGYFIPYGLTTLPVLDS